MIIALLLVLFFGAVAIAIADYMSDSRITALKKEQQRRIKLGYDK
jgi:hypothetical protein